MLRVRHTSPQNILIELIDNPSYSDLLGMSGSGIWQNMSQSQTNPRHFASPASLRCGPWARHIYPSLVLVQPRKTRPYLTERLLMRRKESNQTNKPRHFEARHPHNIMHTIDIKLPYSSIRRREMIANGALYLILDLWRNTTNQGPNTMHHI